MQRRTCLGMFLSLIGGGASAQTVFRCGPDGRLYSDRPCAQGREVAVHDPRDEQQRSEAAAVADAERRLGQDLQQARQAREARTAPAQAGRLSPTRPTAAPADHSASNPARHSHRGRRRHRDRSSTRPDDFVAVPAGTRR